MLSGLLSSPLYIPFKFNHSFSPWWKLLFIFQPLSSLTLCDPRDVRLRCPPLSPRVCSNSHPLSWCHYITMSFSTAPFSFCLLSFPESGSLPMSWLFASGGQTIGDSALASVLPMNIEGWFPLGLTCLISLLSKRLLRAFSRTVIQKHQFFGPQPFLWSISHIHTWLLEKPSFDYMDLCRQSDVSAF